MNTLGHSLLIANPVALSGAAEAKAEQAVTLLEARGADITLQFTEAAGHAVQLAADAGDYDTLIVLGGDGVVHEAANGLMQLPREQRPVFGHIPVGSGNDYARTLGMSENFVMALDQLVKAHVVPFDIGICNGEYFVETLSFGLDAAIALDTVERRKHSDKRSAVLYAESGIDQLLHNLRTYRMKMLLDAVRPVDAPVVLMAVQIGPTYGGGFRICPDAKPDDGLFDICYAVGPVPAVKALPLFLLAKDAHHTKFKRMRFERAERIHVSFDARPAVQMDGEPHIADEYDISIMKQELQVLIP